MNCDSSFGSSPSEMVVKPRTSVNSIVSSRLSPSMVKALRMLRHLVDQLGRHVLAEQAGDLALAASFDEIAVRHVEREEQRDHQQSRGERQHQVRRSATDQQVE